MSTNTKLSGNLISLPNKHPSQQLQQPSQQHQQHQQQHQQQSTQQQNSQIQHPPRYQPPPQPPGGILKHIILPSSSSSSSSKSSVPSSINYTPELSANHLNIKYPPEVPKLSAIYLPDSIKNPNGNNHHTSRLLPPRSSQLRLPTITSQSLLQQQQQQQQHQTAQTLQRLANEEDQINLRLAQNHQQQEMLKFVRKPDTEQTTTTSNSTATSSAAGGRLSMEQNRHLQNLIAELRALKDDNQELRDLCCFLDDDRQKGRKLAREWQRFGRYTASVMRQEVSAYQSKLRQLDDKQQELIRDNLELKELCLYLDEERTNTNNRNVLCANCGTTSVPLRDDGDGSSSSTNADEPMPNIGQFGRTIAEMNVRPTLSDQTLQYVRSLENRIKQLEDGNANIPMVEPISGRPEAVVRALQVLEVREQLERERGLNPAIPPEQLDDGEKALVREMCNVVWRKLEDGPNGGMDHM